MSEIICPNCGARISASSNFCPYCGAPLKQSVPSNTMSSQQTSAYSSLPSMQSPQYPENTPVQYPSQQQPQSYSAYPSSQPAYNTGLNAAVTSQISSTFEFLKVHPIGWLILVLMLAEGIIDILDILDQLDWFFLGIEYGAVVFTIVEAIMILVDAIVIYQLYIFIKAVDISQKKYTTNIVGNAVRIIKGSLKKMFVLEIIWGVAEIISGGGFGMLYYVALFAPLLGYFLIGDPAKYDSY